MKKVYIIAIGLFLLMAQNGWAQMFGWDFSGQTNYGTSPLAATTSITGITVGGLTRAAGIATTGSGAAQAWGGTAFSTTASTQALAKTANDYISFTVTVNASYTASITSIDPYNIRRSNTGPTTGQWGYQIGAGAINLIGSPITWGTTTNFQGNPQTAISLTGFPLLQNMTAGTVVTFYLYTWGATNVGGTWYLNDPSFTPPLNTNIDLAFEGTACNGTAGSVSSAAGIAGNAQATISWVNPTCYDDMMIIESTSPISTTAPTSTPALNSSLYGGTVVYIAFPGVSPQVFTGLTNGTPYYFTLFTRLGATWGTGVPIATTTVTPSNSFSNPTDYYRSYNSLPATSGVWSAATTWQSSPDNATWQPATTAPTSASKGITIQSGYTVTVNSAVSLDKTTVSGTLTLATGGSINVVGTTTYDLNILSGGTLIANNTTAAYTSAFSFTGTAPLINVNSGGLIKVSSNAGGGYSALGGSNLPTVPTNTNWNDGATFQWDNTAPFSASPFTYFPNLSATPAAMPVFKVTQNIPLGVGGGSALLVNGVFEVDAATIVFAGTSTSTFRNGIVSTGSGALTQSAQQQFIISGAPASFGGVTINLFVGTTTALSGTFVFSATATNTTMINNVQFNGGGGSTSTTVTVTAGAVIDASNHSITSNAAIPYTINGTILTVNSAGLNAATGATFDKTNTPVVTLSNTTSTIVYYSAGGQSVSADSYGNLTISGGGVKTMVGSINVKGALTLTSGTFKIGANTLSINGSISYGGATALTGSILSNIIVGSTATNPIILNFATTNNRVDNALSSLECLQNVTLNNSLYIDGGDGSGSGSFVDVVPSGKVLTTGGFLTLESNSVGTAYILTGGTTGGYISGNVTVERYMPPERAWRLLAVPVTTTALQTINTFWQEGAAPSTTSPLFNSNPSLGFGTHISGPGGATNFYDQTPPNNPSILYFNAATQAFSALPAPYTHTAISTYLGYMLFVRGDRSYPISTSTTFTSPQATTLRTTGTLDAGVHSGQVGLLTGSKLPFGGFGWQIISNPYPCTIALDNLFGTPSNYSNLSTSYDVLLPVPGNSTGAFCAVSYDGSDPYVSSIDETILPPADYGQIESGQAFMCYYVNPPVSPGPGSLLMQEDYKVQQSDVYAFRPTAAAHKQLRATLYVVNADNTKSLTDGTLDLFGSNYSDSVSWMEDAKKLSNPNENISIQKNGYLQAIEKRSPLKIGDTLFYSMSHLKQQNYALQLVPVGLSNSGLTGILIDNYLNTRTTVSLNDKDTTAFKFTVDSNAGSADAARFKLVFTSSVQGSPLPVTFTTVKASEQKNGIAVQWDVTNQLNIKEYKVEKSIDGTSFTDVAVLNAKAGVSSDIYDWLDSNTPNEKNYYRIVSVGNDGTLSYSQVVSIKEDRSSSINIYPNPVKDGVLGLQLTNMPKGVYILSLFNATGQKITTTEITHQGGSCSQQIILNKELAKGLYRLEVIKPDNTNAVINVNCQ
jgi:hypothetical protein